MATTHFTGPVASSNGFNTVITNATVPVNSTITSNTIQDKAIQLILTNSQVLALFSAPVLVIAPPAVGSTILIESVMLYKPVSAAGTIGSATSITLGYTSGVALTSTQAVTGFLDQTTAQSRLLFPITTSITPADAVGVTIRLGGANVTGIDSTLAVAVNYKIIPTVLS